MSRFDYGLDVAMKVVVIGAGLAAMFPIIVYVSEAEDRRVQSLSSRIVAISTCYQLADISMQKALDEFEEIRGSGVEVYSHKDEDGLNPIERRMVVTRDVYESCDELERALN